MIKEKENKLHLKYKRRYNYTDDCNPFPLFLFNPITKVIILFVSTEKLALVFPPLTLSNRRISVFIFIGDIGDTGEMSKYS